MQKNLRFTVSRLPGENQLEHAFRQRLVNGTESLAKVPPDKLLADLLKRESRRVMSDITECGPDTIPAHLARVDFLRELINHATRHELIPGAETRLSGRQLLYAHTVADFLAALQITRQTHRAPAFLNQRDSDIAEINRKLDLLAGLFAKSPALEQILEFQIEADTTPTIADWQPEASGNMGCLTDGEKTPLTDGERSGVEL